MIRGFAANSVLLVVDGVRMNNAIYRGGNLQNVISIDANTIDNAEVIFGPGSVMYGSDALGGVMDFHTLRPGLAVGEDIDLSFRAQLAGYRCVYAPKAVVRHKISRTVGVGSDFQFYHSRRNVEYVYFKNMPLPLLFLTLPVHLIYNIFRVIYNSTT